jgi:hypothetical protein
LGFDAAGYYAEHGGLALGLETARRLAIRLTGWRTPPATALPARLVADRPAVALRDLRPVLPSVPHAVKRSGTGESFSPRAQRGVNSSRGTTWLVPGPGVRLRDVAAALAEPVAADTRSIVLQQVATCSNGRSFLVHAYADQVVVECFTGDDTHLVVVTRRLDLAHVESTAHLGVLGAWAGDEARRIAAVHFAAVDLLGFPLNTEGFTTGDEFIALQLRPVPQDRPTAPELTAVLRGRRGDAVAYTRFVWGVFDVTARLPVGVLDAADDRCPVLITASRQARELGPAVAEAAGTAQLGGPRERRRRAVWDLPGFYRAVSQGRQVLIIDPDSGFHLNHRPEFLPPAGPLRAAYCYMSLPSRLWPGLSGGWLRLISDGEQAITLVADGAAGRGEREGRP